MGLVRVPLPESVYADLARRSPGTGISREEAAVLGGLAQGAGTVLEVGCDHGMSTVVLSRVAHRVISVDHFRGDRWCGFRDRRDLWTWQDTVEYYGFSEAVVLMIGDWREVLPLLTRRVDVAFLDAEHDRSSVVAQLTCCAALGAKVMAVHDYGRYEVADAVDDWVRRHAWTVQVVDHLAVLR